MKHNKTYKAFLFLLSLLYFCSCGDSSDAASQDAVSVTETIQVSVLPIEVLATGGTPVQTTRADVDKTATEKEVKSAYVVQFNGTAASNTVTWVSGNVAAYLNSGSPITCNFALTAGVKSRVYVVANPKSVPTMGTTLASFETIPYTVASTLPATGLPMAASQDVMLGDKFNLFQLKSPLARLTFTSTGTLTLRGIPSAYSLVMGTSGATAVRPSDVTYTNTASLTSGTAYYVPANLSGQVGLSSSELRCSLFAPANAMYVVISTNGTTYNIYLGDGSASDFNVVSNSAYTINPNVKGNDSIEDLRVGIPIVTALDDSGTANCYIATSPNKWYSFNGKVMGNGKSTPLPANMDPNSVASAIVPTALNPVSTDVLWETWNTATAPTANSVVKEVCVINGKVVFRTGAYEGNAVVAARDASNNIIWSWHIWRINTDPTLAENTATTTDYTSSEGTFDDTKATTHPGFTMMKLNLGALSFTPGDALANGLYYQWGRKDPFKGTAATSTITDMAITPADAFSTALGGTSITPADAVKNPSTFYLSGSNWTTRNDNLWGTPVTKTVISSYYNSNYGSKSIYDPCPTGWRVPPAYVYVNFTHDNCPWDDTNKGRDFKSIFNGTTVWYPAAGHRGPADGVSYSVGMGTNHWLSTPSSGYTPFGHKMFFNYESMYSGNGANRANGYSLRCMKEQE